jgi:hypothetical protein
LDDLLLVGPLHERQVMQLIASYGGPAFVRRARRVQDAFDVLVAHCQRQRDKWLTMVCIRLALLHALAGDWARLSPWLTGDAQLAILRGLHAELSPMLRAESRATASQRKLSQALREFVESVQCFNSRWRPFLEGVDLTGINQLREGYNRFYLLEKECVVRSPRLARQGYRPLPAVTVDELTALFPLLPVPRLKP